MSTGLEKNCQSRQHDVVSETSIDELRQEVAMWRNYAKEIGAQLAAARKEIERLKAEGSPAAQAPGFERFWSAWPVSSRKVNKKACLTRWISEKLEANADAIVQHVEASKESRDWTREGGQYIPAPLVYLRQERFLAPAPARQASVGSLSGITYSSEGINHDGSFN